MPKNNKCERCRFKRGVEEEVCGADNSEYIDQPIGAIIYQTSGKGCDCFHSEDDLENLSREELDPDTDELI